MCSSDTLPKTNRLYTNNLVDGLLWVGARLKEAEI
jgi:hypothetical protein